ncbi:MAG: hypothetical protein ACE5RJ_01330 [Nitrosopumilaceae archaeon]
MKIERKTIFLVAIISTVLGVGVMANQSSAESPNAIRLDNYSILGPQVGSDGTPVLNVGQHAVITVSIEKIIDVPLKDVMIKAYTSGENGKYLLIPQSTIYAGIKMTDPELLANDAAGIREQLIQRQDISAPMMFQVIAIDSTSVPIEETITVVLFANGEEMDRLSSNVIVKTKGI